MDPAPRNYSGLFGLVIEENLMPGWLAHFWRLRISQMKLLFESIIIASTFTPIIYNYIKGAKDKLAGSPGENGGG